MKSDRENEEEEEEEVIHELVPAGYSYVSRNRKNRKGGGIIIIYKETLQIKLSKNGHIHLSKALKLHVKYLRPIPSCFGFLANIDRRQ